MFGRFDIVTHTVALTVVASFLILLAGCEGDASTQNLPTNATAATPTLSPPATRLPTATPFPIAWPSLSPAHAFDFRFVLFQGEDILGESEMFLSELQGRPLVLNFWARYCTPCWSEMPELQAFYEEYEDRVQLVGVDVGQFTGLGSPKDAGKLLTALGVTYPAGFTDDSRVVQKYGIRAMPTTTFINADGEVFRTWTGSITREQVTAIAREMLEGE